MQWSQNVNEQVYRVGRIQKEDIFYVFYGNFKQIYLLGSNYSVLFVLQSRYLAQGLIHANKLLYL